jgi:hypothetical protein
MTDRRNGTLGKGTMAISAFLLMSRLVSASILLDTGDVTFTPTGDQTDRLFRSGDASTWGAAKPFPGVLGDAAVRAYEQFTVSVGITNFLQINLDDPKQKLFDAAYAPAFTPNNTPPFFGLDINYLGDPGITQPFGNPNSFQIVVPRSSTVVISIAEVDPGGGLDAPFHLQVEGFLDAGFSDVPEPAPVLLFAAGLTAMAAVRRFAER